jgi:acyl carrier protein
LAQRAQGYLLAALRLAPRRRCGLVRKPFGASMVDDVFRAVSEIIAKKCGLDATAPTPDTSLAEIHVESLDLVEIMFEIEERFGIEVPQNINAGSRLEFATVGQIVDGVKSILNNPKTT